MVQQTAPHYKPDPRITAAEAAIASALGLSASDVNIEIGGSKYDEAKDSWGARIVDVSPSSQVRFNVNIHKDGAEVDFERHNAEIRAVLAALPPLANVAQWTPEEDLVTGLKEKIEAATAGTSFHKELLSWPGFDPEVVKKGYNVENYALSNVQADHYGVSFSVKMPAAEGQDTSQDVMAFSTAVKERAEKTKKQLGARVEKYVEANLAKLGKSADEIKAAKDKVKEDIAKLQITTNTEGNRVEIFLRSPDQAEAYQKATSKWATPDNADGLRATNPLTDPANGLTNIPVPATDTTPEIQPQLHRALGRSFLFNDDKTPIPEFTKVAGRMDIDNAIGKSLATIAPQHPERKAQFEEIMKSPALQSHADCSNTPGKVGVAPAQPSFKRITGENDLIQMELQLKSDKDPAKDQIKQVIEGLAGQAKMEVREAEIVDITTLRPTQQPPAVKEVASSWNPLNWLGLGA